MRGDLRQPHAWPCVHTATDIKQEATCNVVLNILNRLLQTTLETGSEDGMNLVVFGGGFAATLVAFLVHSVFEVRLVCLV